MWRFLSSHFLVHFKWQILRKFNCWLFYRGSPLKVCRRVALRLKLILILPYNLYLRILKWQNRGLILGLSFSSLVNRNWLVSSSCGRISNFHVRIIDTFLSGDWLPYFIIDEGKDPKVVLVSLNLLISLTFGIVFNLLFPQLAFGSLRRGHRLCDHLPPFPFLVANWNHIFVLLFQRVFMRSPKILELTILIFLAFFNIQSRVFFIFILVELYGQKTLMVPLNFANAASDHRLNPLMRDVSRLWEDTFI